MSELKLVQASRSRLGGHWDPEDYDVVLTETGQAVGRIYARMCVDGRGEEWWWGFGFPYTLNAKHPFCGLAETKEAAKQAFAERWRTDRQGPIPLPSTLAKSSR
jgi:hypothetical protein